jgi:O-antigen/teichoic acid export membrane protein
VLSLCGVGLLLSIGRPLMQLLTQGRVAWDPVLAVVIGARVVVQGVTGVYATSLGALGVAREPFPVVLLQAVLNVGACFWMVRRLGAVGGALASLVTFSLTSALYLPWKTKAVLS